MAKLTDLVRPLIQQKNIVGLTGGGSTKLDGIATTVLPLSPVPIVMFAIGSVINFYLLRAGTDAESSPDIIRPDDYAGGTNEKVWEKYDALNTFPILAPDGSFTDPSYSFANEPRAGMYQSHDIPTETGVLIFNWLNAGVVRSFVFGTDGILTSSTDLTLSGNNDVILSPNMGGGGRVLCVGALAVNDIEARTGATINFGDHLICEGNVEIAGSLQITTGANQRAGNAVLVAGTVAVANVAVSANTVIMLTRKTAGGTLGSLTYTLNAGVGFTIDSSDVADTSTISYLLIELV